MIGRASSAPSNLAVGNFLLSLTKRLRAPLNIALIPLGSDGRGRRLIFCDEKTTAQMADDSRAFRAENGLQLATREPRSHALPGSNSLVSTHVKHWMQAIDVSSHGELFGAIEELVSTVRKDTLHAVLEQ